MYLEIGYIFIKTVIGKKNPHFYTSECMVLDYQFSILKCINRNVCFKARFNSNINYKIIHIWFVKGMIKHVFDKCAIVLINKQRNPECIDKCMCPYKY